MHSSRNRLEGTTGRLTLLAVSLLVALGSVALVSGAWTDDVTIEGTITTGTWEEPDGDHESAWAQETCCGPGTANYVECEPGKTVDLAFGKKDTTKVGTVTFSDPIDGFIVITIALDDEWGFSQDDGTNVYIQDYSHAELQSPITVSMSSGHFDHQFDAPYHASPWSTPTGLIPENDCYAIHVNVD